MLTYAAGEDLPSALEHHLRDTYEATVVLRLQANPSRACSAAPAALDVLGCRLPFTRLYSRLHALAQCICLHAVSHRCAGKWGAVPCFRWQLAAGR